MPVKNPEVIIFKLLKEKYIKNEALYRSFLLKAGSQTSMSDLKWSEIGDGGLSHCNSEEHLANTTVREGSSLWDFITGALWKEGNTEN